MINNNIPLISFFDRVQSSLAAKKNKYVFVTESPHWAPQGKRWLAFFVSELIDKFGHAPIVVGDPVQWEYSKFKCISFQDFTATVDAVDDLVVLSTSHNCPLAKSLVDSYIYNIIDMTSYAIDPKKIEYIYNEEDSKNIAALFKSISDPDSIANLSSILFARYTGLLSFINVSKYPIYQHPVIDFSSMTGVVIDAGSYDGKESEILRKICEKAESIYSFEFDERNYTKFKDNINPEIKYINAGLWSTNTKASVSGNGIASKVNINFTEESGTDLVKLDTFLPENCNVSFIKMDIEGAEIDAIRGSYRVIQTQKPILAISLYHRPNDLWLIPKLILDIRSDYKFFIGQHDKLLSETVLYAI
ncbi:MAG TPA: hypothetical protein DCE78_07440 [Bacteroidetes bacterium]|nr:hypothetical protein [Bacteroidota bacterium]